MDEMIESIQLKNFKSLCNESAISLERLSIFCGSNSSGKSSLIQSLLMLSQTLSSRYSTNSIVLNGYLARLGSFDDIKTYQSSEDKIDFNFSLRLDSPRPWHDGIKKIDVALSFGKRTKVTGSGYMDDDLHPSLSKIYVKIHSKTEAGYCVEHLRVSPAWEPENAQEGHIESVFKVEDLSTPEEEVIGKEFPDYKILGCTKIGFVPSTLLLDFDYTKKISSQILAMMTGLWNKRVIARGRAIDESGILIPASLFQEIKNRIIEERNEVLLGLRLPPEVEDALKVQALRKKLSIEQIKEELLSATFSLRENVIEDIFLSRPFTPLAEWLSFLHTLDPKMRKALIEFVDKHRADLQEIWYQGVEKERKQDNYVLKHFNTVSHILSSDFPRSIKYLGPLRNEPLAVYPSIGQIDPYNVGLKGEFTAAVLHINKYRIVNYPSPVTGEDGEFTVQARSATLLEACRDWLSYLGVVKEVSTKDKGKLGYELQVKTGAHEKWQDLTHVGVGVSQVLPIVLICLLSDKDDVLIFEQPELHLHPKVQSRLCDFFIAMGNFGRQCLVETHSEYLINRLRLRIVQGEQENLKETAPVYFIEKKAGKSDFKRVAINKYGVILDWPEDFFDQTDREVEAILIEASKRKRMEKAEKADQADQAKKAIKEEGNNASSD